MIATYLRTLFNGHLVGEDAYGTRYYEEKRLLFKRSPTFGQSRRKRRWAVYKEDVDASYIPADWHGWLHYTKESPPQKTDPAGTYPWIKGHQPNLTGTPHAYCPEGSLMGVGKVQKQYQPWTPNPE